MIKKIAIVPYVTNGRNSQVGHDGHFNIFKKKRSTVLKEYLQSAIKAKNWEAEVIVDVNHGDLQSLKREGVNLFLIPEDIAKKVGRLDLLTDYNNLVYSCRVCNRNKRNNWPFDNVDKIHDDRVGFVDPATDEFDEHMMRDETGRIVPKTQVGNYMYKIFNFSNRLTEVWWKLSLISKEIKEITLSEERNRIMITDLKTKFRDIIHIFETTKDTFEPVTKPVELQIENIEKMGYAKLPICIAKTQYSFSDDPKNLECKDDYNINVRGVELKNGAGFVVVLAGKIMTMPGLPKVPAAESIDIDEDGEIVGIF